MQMNILKEQEQRELQNLELAKKLQVNLIDSPNSLLIIFGHVLNTF